MFYGADGGPPYFPGALGKRNQMFDSIAGNFPANECWRVVGQPVVSTLFFIFFVLIAAFIILSLFIGAVCGGMSDAVEEFEAEERKAKEKEKARLAALEEPKYQTLHLS